MDADPDVQLRLLDLQTVDSRLDQLAHRRRSLPEAAAARELENRIAGLRARVVAGETEVADLTRAQTKADADVEQVRTRAARDNELLLSGRLTNAKEIENLQHEIESLARRQSDLEDIELEVMEKLEDARASLTGLQAEVADAEVELAQLATARDEAFAGLDAEAATATAERSRLATGLPAELSALYEKLRADHNGVGAAPLHRGRCEGCRTELATADIARIRTAAPTAVLRCEECRRILVRTAESGL